MSMSLLSNAHFFRCRMFFLYGFQTSPARVKDRRFYEIHSVDKVCTERSEVSYLQVLGRYEAVLLYYD